MTKVLVLQEFSLLLMQLRSTDTTVHKQVSYNRTFQWTSSCRTWMPKGDAVPFVVNQFTDGCTSVSVLLCYQFPEVVSDAPFKHWNNLRSKGRPHSN